MEDNLLVEKSYEWNRHCKKVKLQKRIGGICMKEKIKIGDREFSQETIDLITGEKGSQAQEVKDEWIPILGAIEEPEELPFLISDIVEIEPTEELRLVLVRVQVNSRLKMKQDLNYYKREEYVAQAIEKLLFGRLKLKARRKKGKSSLNENG